jgi:hypothetical protein
MVSAEVKSNMAAAESARRLSAAEVAVRLGAIKKIQQLAGHFPSEEALDRARRILTGEITSAEALAEIHAKRSD